MVLTRPQTRVGRIQRVNGPLVEVSGLAGAAMGELVALGVKRLPAEIVAISTDTVVLQAYEYTGGLRVGDTAVRLHRPLSAALGPHLLGGVFDGLLRPLSDAPRWLGPRQVGSAHPRRWPFLPVATPGRILAPGTLLGTVPGAGAVEHRVLMPPGLGGRLDWLAGPGELGGTDVLARVGSSEVRLVQPWPVRRPRPHAGRVEDVVPLHTGQRALDLLFPLARGSAAAVPGGFGTGKTMLLQQIAKWCDADVIVYVCCGERGNEMAEALDELATLTDPRTGGRLMDRTVILANSSNMPMMAREASIHTGVTVAEFYRDMGYDAVVIADSTSRWAEALREFASRTGALPAEEGYPADLASALAAFYERAGRVLTLGGATASVTVVGAISPPGGDLTEPVTTATQRFVQAVWSLDRDLAYSRHYPAVSWSGSFSRDIEPLTVHQSAAADPEWTHRRARAASLLAEADRLASLVEIIGRETLPGHERVVLLAGRLLREGVLMQSALSHNDAHCSPEKAAALLDLVLAVVDACLERVAAGTPATVLETFDFGPLLRLRDTVAADDASGVWAMGEPLLAAVAALGALQ